MVEDSTAEMSRYEFSVAYTGYDRTDDHSIDVQALAPALLAFGKLLREANAEFNEKRSTAKVLVVSDFEHKCFNINFELVISFYERLKSLVATAEAKDAKDILEWVGMVGGSAVTVGFPFLKYLAWKKGRKVAKVEPVLDQDQKGIVKVTVEGDSNAVHVHQHVYNLSENPAALRATRDTFLPLGNDGFDRIQMKDGDSIIEEIGGGEVDDIVASCTTGIDESKETEPDIEETSAWLSVYSPVYDAKAPIWRFKLGKDVIYVDISETDIAQQALARGGAMVDDAYQVRLRITVEVDGAGKRKAPTYKVIGVVKFVPAGPPQHQGELPDM